MTNHEVPQAQSYEEAQAAVARIRFIPRTKAEKAAAIRWLSAERRYAATTEGR